MKEQEGIEEQEVLKRYGLPFFTSIPKNKEEVRKEYNNKIKVLGSAKAGLTRKIKLQILLKKKNL